MKITLQRPVLAMIRTPGLLILCLLMAGCSIGLPPGIPRTGALTATPSLVSTVNLVTPTPTNLPTNTPVVVTSTPVPPTATSAPVVATTSAPPTSPTSAQPTNSPPTSNPPASTIPLPGQVQTIQFAQNTSTYVVTTNLQAGAVQAYQLNIAANQHMYITTDGNASITVYDPNRVAFTGIIQVPNPTRFNLFASGNYTIAVQGTGPVAMSVYIPPAGSDWSNPVPVPPDVTPIQFPSGATSVNLTANTAQGLPVGYSISAQAGQRMTVTTNGNAIAFLTDASKNVIPSLSAPTHQFIFPLQQTGTYFLVLLADGPAAFTVSIPPLSVPQTGGQGTPIAVPGSSTRVTFGTGNASATVNTTLTAGQPKAYVVNVQAGQTLYVSTTGKVDVTAYGPGNTVLVNGHADFPNRWTIPASQTGDYTFVISGNGATTLTFYAPPK